LWGWSQVIDPVEFVPATGGIFDVHLTASCSFAKAMLRRYPESEDVAARS
jgi:hypothetical protein